jgi:hypothetical protein
MYIYHDAYAYGGDLMERDGSSFTLWLSVKNTASTCQYCTIILDDLA